MSVINVQQNSKVNEILQKGEDKRLVVINSSKKLVIMDKENKNYISYTSIRKGKLVCSVLFSNYISDVFDEFCINTDTEIMNCHHFNNFHEIPKIFNELKIHFEKVSNNTICDHSPISIFIKRLKESYSRKKSIYEIENLNELVDYLK